MHKTLLILSLLALTLNLHAGHMNIGYSSISMKHISKKDMIISMQVWVDEMIATSTHTASFKFYDDINKISDDFNSDKLDYVIAYGLEFVKYFDKSKLVDGFSGGMQKRSDENLIAVISNNTTLEKIKEIKKPTVAIQKGDDISELYTQNKILKNKRIIFLETDKRNDALLKLFFNKADMAIVLKKTYDFAKELNPQIGKRLKVVDYSDIPAGSFGYFRKGFDPKLRDEIKELAFKLTKDERGKQIFILFQTDALVEIGVKDLEPIEKLYKKSIQLKVKN